jgi:hypothetical protein
VIMGNATPQWNPTGLAGTPGPASGAESGTRPRPRRPRRDITGLTGTLGSRRARRRGPAAAEAPGIGECRVLGRPA